MTQINSYVNTENVLNNVLSENDKNNFVRCQREDKVYKFEDALDIAGNGAYSYQLLATVMAAIFSMGVDLFCISVVVAGCRCELELTAWQQNILLSAPIVGPVVTSYAWGYISDTQGRRRSLQAALWGAFLAASVSAFSVNWAVLAFFKFLSSSLCSCAQSASYPLLGETNCGRVRGSHMLLVTSVVHTTAAFYFSTAYLVLNLDFSYDLGLLAFTPWRLLSLLLALPLGLSALGLQFLYESPKFLLNSGKEVEALEVLKNIHRRNWGSDEVFQVEKLVLEESGNLQREKTGLLHSLYQQTAPLFTPPLLWRTLQLYYLTAVVYSTNNAFLMWYPFLSDAFFQQRSLTADGASGLCSMIQQSGRNVSTIDTQPVCSSKIELQTVYSIWIQAAIFTSVNVIISKMAARKKLLTISLFAVVGLSALGTVVFKDNTISFIFFVLLLATGLLFGPLSSYFVEAYPTSFRGMASCLSVTVSRSSGLAGINVLGAALPHCTTAFYVWAAFVFSGAVVACFLPPDKRKSNK